MRNAAATSVAIHFGLIAGAFLFLNLEPAVDDMAAELVSVDILSVDMVSLNPSEEITELNQTLISAGAEVETEEVPETAVAESVEVAEVEPARAVEAVAAPAEVAKIAPTKSEEVASAEVLTAAPEAIAPVEAVTPQLVDATAAIVADSVAASPSDPLEAMRTATIGQLTPDPAIQRNPPALLKPAEAIKPVATASLAPVIEEELQVAPVPKPRITRKPVEAKVETPKEQPAEKPKQADEPVEKKPDPKPPSKQASLGNGGAADADSAASKKSGGGQGKQNNGGSAAKEAYAGKVRAKVSRSVKTPKGKFESGEARIMVLISANGQVLKTTMSRSSGDQKVDDAAAAAVKRAAPFPPIPDELGQSSVTITLPIYISS